MSRKDKKILEKLNLGVKIYLVIIFLLLTLICFYERKFIIPSIIFYVVIIIVTYILKNRSNNHIFRVTQELTLNVDNYTSETLIHFPIPVILIKESGNVSWKNAIFSKEFASVNIGETVNGIIKEFQTEKEEQNEIRREIKIGENTYEVIAEKVKTENRDSEKLYMIYFINRTEKIEAFKKFENEKSCIAIIMIDNYEEVMQRIPNESRPKIIADIENKIFEWSQKTGGLMIKTERDKYIYLFRQEFLPEIEENKFSILDGIKEIELGERLQLTLSIAASNEGTSEYEKYKSANSAMDIALGRGGDQAVVKKDGKYFFFGGRAEEVEKRTKVKARIVSHALEELIQESEQIIIMGHTNGDIDSVGSAVGLSRLAKSLEKDVYILYDSRDSMMEIYMKQLEEDEEYRDMIIDRAEALNLIDKETLLIVIDTHKIGYTELPELLEATDKIVIIDHHRRAADFIEKPILTFHEVYASSSAELVTEIIQYAPCNPNLTNFEAESLYAGIMVDTKNFTFKTGVRTFEAAAYLKKVGIDIIKIKKWFQSNLEDYSLIADIVKNAEVIRDTIAISICENKASNTSVMCAKGADELLTINNITASFVVGDLGNKVSISGRSIGDINVQVILEKLGGGGHITVAGTQIEDITLEEAKEKLIEKINEYLDETIN